MPHRRARSLEQLLRIRKLRARVEAQVHVLAQRHDVRVALGHLLRADAIGRRVVAEAHAWAARGQELFVAAPALRSITLTGLHVRASDHGGAEASAALVLTRFKRAMASPLLRRLEGLGHGTVGYGQDATDDLSESIERGGEETISLGAEAMELLLAADISRLRSLAPYVTEMDALATAPVVKNLECLELFGTADPAKVLAALDPARLRSLGLGEWHEGLSRFPGLRELEMNVGRTKPVRHVPPGLNRLWCRVKMLTAEDIAAISACSQLVELELIAHTMPGWRALEHARFDDLRHLSLDAWQIRLAEWRELSRWPIAKKLELLQVREVSEATLAELQTLFGCIVELRP